MKIVKIGALWCPACLITNNALDKINKNYSIDIENLDYDFDEEEVKKYNVGDILPEIVFIKDGKEVDRLIGEKNYKEIEEVLKKYEEV